MTAAVLLDWDGTLVDSRARVLAAHRAATPALLGRPFPDGDDEEVLALTTAEARLFARLTDGDLARAAALTLAFRLAYLDAAEPVALLPGAADLMAGLLARGVPVGLVTAKAAASVDCDLDALGAAGWFGVVVPGDGVHPPKPDPAGVRAALEALGAPAERVLFVGDAGSDVRAGRAAGVRTAGALYGFDPAGVRAAGPDALVDAPADVLALLDPDLPILIDQGATSWT